MKSINEKTAGVKILQAEMDHRAEVEQKAEQLICQCRFEEAKGLLDSLDNELVLGKEM